MALRADHQIECNLLCPHTYPQTRSRARTGSEELPVLDTTTRATAARTIAIDSAAARAGRLDAARAGATAWKLSMLSQQTISGDEIA